MNFYNDYRLWLAVLGAAVFKVALSPWYSLKRAAVTLSAACFCAWLLTDPALHFMNLAPEVYGYPAAALMAFTGDGIIRWLMRMTPEKLLAMWRGNS